MAKYQRMNALQYAGVYWDKICHDGRIATSVNYYKRPPGSPLSDGALAKGYQGNEDDCTHFISCCIGQSTGSVSVLGKTYTIKGGGLPVPSPFHSAGVYGETHVTRMYYFALKQGGKIIGSEFRDKGDPQTEQDIVANLSPGDLLIYSRKPNIANHAHCVLLITPTMIACHTYMRFGKHFTDVGLGYVTLMKMP